MSTATRADRPIVLQGIPFGTYLRIRRENDPYRMTYEDGTLEILPRKAGHEYPSRLLDLVVVVVAGVFEIPVIGVGSTTFTRGEPRRKKGAGTEPDASFYFGEHAARIRRKIEAKEEIDLDFDPPPDLWVEVDHRANSRSRLPLYSRLGVPEVWRYRVATGKLWFGRRENDRYVVIDRSLALPMLTPERVLLALGHAGEDSGAWVVRWLPQWAGSLRD